MDIIKQIDKSVNGTDADIASVVHVLFKDKYICTSIEKNIWYEFIDNKWILCDSAYSLKILLSSDVSKEYSRRAAFWALQILNDDDEFNHNIYKDKTEKLLKISINLKMNIFKKNIIEECCELFYKKDINFL
jgi:hypothetical protein